VDDEVIIGVDPHKVSNTIAVLDRTEAVLAQQRFANTHKGFAAMVKLARRWPERRWAVEGARGLGQSVAQRLVAEGEAVVDVPAKLATRVRVYSEGHGRKTDVDDAVSVAKAALHSRRLRPVTADDQRVALKLLVDRRHELVGSRTQSVCRLHRLLRELIVGGAPRELSAERADELLASVHPSDPAGQMRRDLALEHIADIRRYDHALDAIRSRIDAAVAATKTTLTRIYGIGTINAAVILAEVGDIDRFGSRDHLASYAGTAPLAVSSGEVERHRLNRSGNRRLNHAIHIAAVVQVSHQTPGRRYYERKLGEGKSAAEALRCVKRRITDAIWRQLQLDAGGHPDHDDHVWPRWPSSHTGHGRYHSPDTPRRNGRPARRGVVDHDPNAEPAGQTHLERSNN
jgi:transposase